MFVEGNAGLAALFGGETTAAARAFTSALSLSRQLAMRGAPLCEALLGLAGVAAARDDGEHAPRLLGAASAHSSGEWPDAIATRLDETVFRELRLRRGASWDADVAAGAALSLDDAVAYALA